MSAVDLGTLGERREEWLEENGCDETEVQLGEAGEFVMVVVETGLKKVYLPDVLQTGYEPAEDEIGAEELEEVDELS